MVKKKILKGRSASRGKATGRVRIVDSLGDMEEFRDGEILVTRMTSPDFVPLMKMASAIITDVGGITSHAAIVSREFGKPCIVGTMKATTALRDGMRVSVDADKGDVFQLSKLHEPESCKRLLSLLNPANDLLKEVITEGQEMIIACREDETKCVDLDKRIYQRTSGALHRAQRGINILGREFPEYVHYTNDMNAALRRFYEDMDFSKIQGSFEDDHYHKLLMALHFEVGEDCGGYREVVQATEGDPIEETAQEMARDMGLAELREMDTLLTPDDDPVFRQQIARAIELKGA